ncbi:Collagen alpha-1(XIV) chain [Tupaia chinensis]|uniref:Collagen alpha-1(XIV) chain n=1 Tax=Tupaia chinensis TaxID=246437 RepID=L9LCT9_TUPCH|nr:Collagen alpha-1(XIV) chain [Tupaia chinensis]
MGWRTLMRPGQAQRKVRLDALRDENGRVDLDCSREPFQVLGRGGKTNQLNLQNTATKAIIQGLMPDQNYTVQIIAYNKDKESKPAQGQFRIKDLEKRKEPKPRVKVVDKGNGSKPSLPEEPKFVCQTPAIADIVILVDGSWSIGRFNFRLVRLFLENLVTAFDVGSEKTRIGLAQYSGDPRIEWHLNAFSTKDEVIEAVRNLPYKGGNTLTGLALNYIFENSFKPEAGSRTGVSKIGILITDGKSQDDIIPPSRNLRESGVELFAIASALITIGPPQDLITSEVTARSFMVNWTHAPGDVEKYRVVYYPTRGGKPDEVVVDGSVSSTVLKNLMSLTEYQIAVFAVYAHTASEGLRGTETTLALPMASDLELYDVTENSLRVRWDAVPGASGYLILYAPLTEGLAGDEKEVEVDPITTFPLKGLTPLTDYTIAIFSIYDEGQSEPLTGMFTTEEVPAQQYLEIDEVTTDSFRVTWHPLSADEGQHKLMWIPVYGGKTEEVILKEEQDAYVIEGLEPGTEYEVSLLAVLDDGSESEVVTAVGTTLFQTGIRNLVVDDETTSSLRVTWDISDSNVQQFRVTYLTAQGDPAEEVVGTVMVPGSQNNLLLKPLLPDTEYKVTVTPIYTDGEGVSVSAPGKTLPSSGPQNLRVSEEWYNRLRITWDPPSSPVKGYRIVYKPVSVPGPTLETFVGADINTILITNLLSGMDYNVKVFASQASGLSDALSGMVKTHTQKQESTVGGGTTRHCFYGLQPDSEYKISVYTKLQEIEGPSVSIMEKTQSPPTQPPTFPPTIPPAKEVCKAAKADLVFMVDGSWSIGDDNFNKIINFLYSTVGALDKIGADGTQVAMVQFTDDPRTEFKLNAYKTKETLLDAIKHISYKGGNTKTGKAIKHVRDTLFNAESGTRRGIPKVIVVITDGRSQDDVTKISREMQLEGYSIFAIGVADADYSELVSIGSKPSARHVFFVDDFDAFKKIEDELITFVCETASATCPLVHKDGIDIADGGKTLTYFNYDYSGEFQTVTFEGPEIRKIFYGSFHKLHIIVSKTLAKVVIDCKQVGEKAINASANITSDGVEVLGRMVRSRGPNGNSAPVSE